MEIVADISVFILACRLFYCGEIFALKAISAAEYVFFDGCFLALIRGQGRNFAPSARILLLRLSICFQRKGRDMSGTEDTA